MDYSIEFKRQRVHLYIRRQYEVALCHAVRCKCDLTAFPRHSRSTFSRSTRTQDTNLSRLRRCSSKAQSGASSLWVVLAHSEVNILLSNGSRGIRFNIKPYDGTFASTEVSMSFAPFLANAAVSRFVGLSRTSVNANNGLDRFIGDLYNVRMTAGRNLLHDASNMNEFNEVWGLPFINRESFFFADYPPHGLFVQTASARPFKWKPAGYRSSSTLTDMTFRDSKLDFRGLWRKIEIEDILPFAFSETYTVHLLSSVSHEMRVDSYDATYFYSLLSLESATLNITVKLTVLQVRPDQSISALFGSTKNGAEIACAQSTAIDLLLSSVELSAFVHLRCLPVDPVCSVIVQVSKFDGSLGRFAELAVCKFEITQLEYRSLLSDFRPTIGGSSKDYSQTVPPLLKLDPKEYTAVRGEGHPIQKASSNGKDCLSSQSASFAIGSHSETVVAFSCNPNLEVSINGQCQPLDLLNGVQGCLALLRTDISKCAKCQPGYFLTNGSCQQCGVGCRLCASSTTCETCLEEWVLEPAAGSCKKFDQSSYPGEFTISIYCPAFQSIYSSSQTSVDTTVKTASFNGTRYLVDSAVLTTINSSVLAHLDLHLIEDVNVAAGNAHLEFVLQWDDTNIQTRSVPAQITDFTNKMVRFDLVLHDVPAGSHRLRVQGLYPFEVRDSRFSVAPYSSLCSLPYQPSKCLICKDELLYLKDGQCQPAPPGFIASKLILAGLNQQLQPITTTTSQPGAATSGVSNTTTSSQTISQPTGSTTTCAPGTGSCLTCDAAQQSCLQCEQPKASFQGKCYLPISVLFYFASPYLFIEFDQSVSSAELRSLLSFSFDGSVFVLNTSCLEIPEARILKCRTDQLSNSTFRTPITLTTTAAVLASGNLMPGQSLTADYCFTPTDPGKSKAAQTVGSVASVAVRTSMGISLISMSGSFSQLMKLTQYVELLVYFNVELPENLATFLQYFTEDVLGELLNPVSKIGMPGCKSPQKFRDNGTDCLILQNSGELIIILFILLTIKMMFASLAQRYPIFKKLSEKLGLGFFCMVFDSVAFELSRDSVLNIYMRTTATPYALVNLALSTAMLLVLVVMNVWLFRKGKNREKLPFVHDGFDFEKFTGRYNIPIQQVVSLACILIIVLGYSKPFFHILSIGSLNLSVWVVYTSSKPQLTRFEYGKSLITNLVISCCMLGMTSFTKEARLGKVSRTLVGLFMIIGLSAVFGLTILSNLLQAIKSAISFYKSTHGTAGASQKIKTRKVVRKAAPKRKRVPVKIKKVPDTDASLAFGQITESNGRVGSSHKIEFNLKDRKKLVSHGTKLNLPKIILPKQSTPPKNESLRLRDSPQKLSTKARPNKIHPNHSNQTTQSSTAVMRTLKTRKIFFGGSSDGIIV